MAVAPQTTNYERVTQGLRILQAALGPFVYRELSAASGGKWWTDGVLPSVGDARRAKLPATGSGKELVEQLDVADLLQIVTRRWELFSTKLSREDRTYLNELIDNRNKWAHHGAQDMGEDDAWRALDTMTRLLEHVHAPSAKETQALAKAVRAAAYAAPPPPAPVIQPPPSPKPAQAGPTGTLPVAVAASEAEPALKPWREVIAPHPDVAAGRYQQAEFAADLSQVLAGKAEPEYQDAVEFFARTYLTEGTILLLTAAVERLSGKGGEPVVQLKTAFGGGKTHTMLAVYHLVRARGKLDSLAGIREILQRAGVTSLPKTSVAVLVGTALEAAGRHLDAAGHGVEVRTLWGEMAAQLGGAEGYAMVREADERGISPGSDTLTSLFDRFGPCLVLVDELVAYVRNLYQKEAEGERPVTHFDNILTFVQALTEAARRSKRGMVVASIPESNMEVGDQAGQRALARIEHTFGRLEAVWKPVDPLEGFEIVRRRLFGPVKDDQAKEAVCRAYSRLYSAGAGDFPRRCGEAGYLERLRAAYPIHPEVFDRLYEDWASLERFQRTRGVLRLMASCIHALWARNDRSLLIQPGSLPLDVPRVRDELLRYLPPGWNSVIDRDVDGDASEPRRIDQENPRFGTLVAASRVARTIFLGSAPHAGGQQVRGIEAVRVRLGVAQPNESIAVFNDALGRLGERLTYLYSGNNRYWYDTHPNLRRTAEDRAAGLERHLVLEEIEKRLKADREKADFVAVHCCPDPTGSLVADEPTARLVVLAPSHTYSRSRPGAEALGVVQAILNGRGNSPRRYPNMLVFMAPDAEAMETLEREVRRLLAWQSIVEDQDMLNLDKQQIKEAATGVQEAEKVVAIGLRTAYRWLLVPSQQARAGQEPATSAAPEERGRHRLGAWTVEAIEVAGDSSPVTRAAKRLQEMEALIVRWSAPLLSMELGRYNLWGDEPHLSVKRLWEDYLCKYGYLPRLRDGKVLLAAIAEGLRGKDYFGYAGSVSPQGRYEGLIIGQATLPEAIHADGLSVLVQPAAALTQIRADEQVAEAARPPLPPDRPGDGPTERPKTEYEQGGGPKVQIKQPPARVYRRYHGKVRLDPDRLGRDAARIAEEIVQHLRRLSGAQVEVTLEIDATMPGGVPEQLVRDLTENGRTLKFSAQGFEED